MPCKIIGINRVRAFLRLHGLSLVLLIITTLIAAKIYGFSAEVSTQSEETSQGVSFFIASLVFEGFCEKTPTEQNELVLSIVPFIRKLAHFLVYAALGFFSFLTVERYRNEIKKPKRRVVSFAVSLMFCLLYATSDEIHQLFVEGRSGSVADVLLDFLGSISGAVFALLLPMIFASVLNKRKNRQTLQ